jgi:hypothetical protein
MALVHREGDAWKVYTAGFQSQKQLKRKVTPRKHPPIRRVEVTVERETVTMLVRGQPDSAAVQPPTIVVEPTCASGPESKAQELPPLLPRLKTE